MKHNPFQMVEVDEALKEEMILKMRAYDDKDVSTHISEDLWAAYQEMLAQKPDMVGQLHQVFMEISADISEPKPYTKLDLSEYTDIYYLDEKSAWYGVKDDTPEEIPEMYQSFEDIYWDANENSWIGITDVRTWKLPNPNLSFVYDAGRNSWFNIFTGEVE